MMSNNDSDVGLPTRRASSRRGRPVPQDADGTRRRSKSCSNIVVDTPKQFPKGQRRPRADQEDYFTENEKKLARVEYHGRAMVRSNGLLCTDRDNYCHGVCEEKTILALLDVTAKGITFPMCHQCCSFHGFPLPNNEFIGKVEHEFTKIKVQRKTLPTNIEVKGSMDELEACTNPKAPEIIFTFYQDFPNDKKQLDAAINQLKKKKLFLYKYDRGFLSTGLQWNAARKILETQPMLKKFLKKMESIGGDIIHGFMGHTLMEGDGIHPFHFDLRYSGASTIRSIVSLGKSNKTMTVQNVKSGRWFTFKVPHGMVVTMTEVGGGVVGDTYVHRVDKCHGSYIIVVEQQP